MTDNRKDNGDNLSHEDRVKGGEHSHKDHDSKNDNSSSQHDTDDGRKNNNGYQFTDEERSRGGKNS